MRGVMSLSENTIKWTIFTVLIFLFPAVVHILLAVVIYPLFPIIVQTIVSLFYGQFGNSFIVGCAIWIGLYYWASKMISKKISNIQEKYKPLLLGGVILVIVLIGFAPINTFITENTRTVYETYQDIGRIYMNKFLYGDS